MRKRTAPPCAQGVAVPDASSRKRVLVTGAAGRIGSFFAQHSADRYTLRLMVQPGQDASAIAQYGEVVEADLADLSALRRAHEGMDACVHLAGQPWAGATWDDLLQNNIVGTYNVFVAALAARCMRVVYASSIHAVSGYPKDQQVRETDPVNPGDIYGVSKCFGEALARYMAGQEGMSAVAIRICAFQPEENVAKESGVWMADAWVSPRDLNQLIQKSIDADHVRFAIAHGISDCQFKRLDLSQTRDVLEYAPQDDAFQTNPTLAPLALHAKIPTHSHADDKDRAATTGLRRQLQNTKE